MYYCHKCAYKRQNLIMKIRNITITKFALLTFNLPPQKISYSAVKF